MYDDKLRACRALHGGTPPCSGSSNRLRTRSVRYLYLTYACRMRTQRCQERLGAPLRGSLCHNGHIHSRYASQVQTAIDVHRSWSYASWISVAPYPRIHWRAGSARCNALPSSRVGVAAGLMRIAGERRCTSAEAQKTHGVTRAPKISPPSTP